MNNEADEDPPDPSVVEVAVDVLRYQRTSWIRVVLILVLGMSFAIAALWYALVRANNTIDHLSETNTCRSVAAAGEAGAVDDAIKLILARGSGEVPARPSDLKTAALAIDAAQKERARAARDGCP